jgi:hypothetical protein
VWTSIPLVSAAWEFAAYENTNARASVRAFMGDRKVVCLSVSNAELPEQVCCPSGRLRDLYTKRSCGKRRTSPRRQIF